VTANQITKRVTFWKNELAHLGLAHWDIDVIIGGQDSDAYASIHPSDHYDSARIFVDPEISKEMLDRVVVHELMHLVTRDLWDALWEATENLSPGEQNVHRTRLRHEMEGVVDRVARSIVKD